MRLFKLLIAASFSFCLVACKKKDSTNSNTTKLTTKKTTWEKSIVKEKSFEKLNFGTFPQSLESNQSIIDELNDMFGELPTKEDSKSWIGNGNIAYNGEDYLWYIDIDKDADGINDYRGIYYINYIGKSQMWSTYEENSMQYKYGFPSGNVYWFKYEPIEWLVLDNDNGKKLLLSNSVLFASVYNYSIDFYKKFDHNGGNGYVTDYDLSDIRQWLINDFYDSAFSSLEKSKICQTLVDNSANQTLCTDKNYDAKDTNDNVFLLSYAEIKKYIQVEKQRLALYTDYTLVYGLEDNTNNQSEWWIRGVTNDLYEASFVNRVGYFSNEINIHCYNIGVRPAIYITE